MAGRRSLLAYLKADRLQGYSIESNIGLSLFPGQVIGLTATGRVIDILTGWTALSGVTGYKLYRSLTSVGGYTLLATLVGDTSNSYTDSAVTAGTEYYYQVRAYNAFGDGIFSNVAHAHTQTVFQGFNFLVPNSSRVWVGQIANFTFLAGDTIICTEYAPFSTPFVSDLNAYVYQEGWYPSAPLPYRIPAVRDYTLTQGYPNTGTGMKITDCRPWSLVMAVTTVGGTPPTFPNTTASDIFQIAPGIPITGIPTGARAVTMIMNSSLAWGGGAFDDFHGTLNVYR